MGKKSDFSKVKSDAPLWVVWWDIHNDEGGWKSKDDLEFGEYKVETLGWFCGVHNEQLVLYADKGQDGDTNTRMLIPVGCVMDWKVVNLG